MRLSIIIINYNTCSYTLESIASVLREKKDDDYEIIVLDNYSNDSSVEQIQSSPIYENICLIPSDKNLGFAGGNNLAIKNATGEYLLLLNPDTIILDHAIDKLVAFAKNYPHAGVWGGRTLFADRSLNPSSCWQRQTAWGLVSQALGLSSLFRRSSLFNPEGIGGWDRQGIREVDIVSGCFLLIRRDLWEKLEGFHPEFFMYGEEADLCLRAREFGASPMVTSEATIIHYGGVSETVRADQLVKLLKAKMLLIKRHFGPFSQFIGMLLLSCWPYTRYLVHSLLKTLGRKSSLESAKVWNEVWHRRQEWFLRN